MAACRLNLSCGSWCHCLRRLAGAHDQDAPFALGPALRNDKAGLDGLARPHLVCQDHTPGKRALKSEESGLDLVRIEVDLGID